MVDRPAAAVICGLTFGAGVVGAVWFGLLTPRPGSGSGTPSGPGPRSSWRSSAPGTGPSRSLRPRHVGAAAAVAVAAVVVTGWPVAALLGAAAAVGVPRLFGRTSGSVTIDRVEAVAVWTEMLHGTLAASAGLQEAIVATAPLCPPSIRPATGRLASRLRSGVPTRSALLEFADELADPSADRVVCALLLAVEARAQRLGDLLAALAESTRDEVAMRLRIETSRASVRSGVRTVLVCSLVFAVGLAVLARPYLSPFGSPTGQLVLVVVGTLYAAGLWLMVRLSVPRPPVRLLPTVGRRDPVEVGGAVTVAAVLGAVCALGLLGLVVACRRRRPSLAAVARVVTGAPDPHGAAQASRALVTTTGEAAAAWLERGPVSRYPGWRRAESALAVTDRDLVAVVSASLIGGGLGLLGPLLVWLAAGVAGFQVPLAVAAVAGILLGLFGVARPWGDLVRAADQRRHHVVVVLGSFVDLVALGLAGGVGVEGALLAAASVSDDWFVRRLHRTLAAARDRGTSPWAALGDLGRRLGVDELVELTSTLQLAGTEGSRIRQALAARSVALRRHLQASEESAANAMTERLFLPGALLLLGFLLFIGYPAVSHVLGGF